MRYTKTIEAHVEWREVHSVTLCDRCGLDVERGNNIYHEDEIEIVARLGAIYPESDNRKVTEIDLCAGCWVIHVVPALQAIGVTVRTRNTWESDSVPEGGAK
jgi:hypothetical protein